MTMDTLSADLSRSATVSGASASASATLTPSERDAVVAAAKLFVQRAFASHDPSHDYHHIHRVHLLALSLTRSPELPPLDMLVVELGALFHDLTDAKYTSSSTTPSSVLAPFWTSLSVAPSRAQIALVEKIVGNVSWSKDARRRAQAVEHASAADLELREWLNSCAEFWCVSDADRLDSIGSIGIMRCAAYSAKCNRPLYIPPNNPQMDPVPPAEQAEGYNGSAIAHFHEKLLKIKDDRLYTQQARLEANRRQAAMASFMQELDLEWIVASQGAELARLEQEQRDAEHDHAHAADSQ